MSVAYNVHVRPALNIYVLNFLHASVIYILVQWLFFKHNIALCILTTYLNFVAIDQFLLKPKPKQTNITFLDPDGIYKRPPSKVAISNK